VSEFLVELYMSRTNPDGVGCETKRARRAAMELTAEGTPVHFLRAIFVPADETCFFFYQAGSVDAVLEAGRRAALRFEHVAETAPGFSQ
jgi:hypothetical protein